MLRSIRVKNLALIREAEIETGEGFNILTGETGAGKSLILGSVGLAMGARAGKDLVREDAGDLLIELVFDHVPDALLQRLAEQGIPMDEDLILTRKITASGRNVCRVNSETVPVSFLREIASDLIQIHGQHEHEKLLDKKQHLNYLDIFAAKQLGEIPDRLAAAWQEYRLAQKALSEAQMDEESRSRELSFLKFETEEIEVAHLEPGEEEELEAQYRTMSHGQKILETLAFCQTLLRDGDDSAAERIGRAVRELMDISSYDESLAALGTQMTEVEMLLGDLNQEISRAADRMEFGEEEFYRVETRLNEIHRLQTKYGNTIEQILGEMEKKQERIRTLENYAAYLEGLRKKESDARAELQQLSAQASEIRTKMAKVFETEITAVLKELNFPHVCFRVEITETKEYTSRGNDEVRFLISANAGEDLRPLDRIASGGELSRIMLAFHTILADAEAVETMIFDEIDSGISGRTAQKVAEKLHEIAAHHQIICITHLPQIAAMGDHHFLIEKTMEENQTRTEISCLSEEEQVKELARMLGGAKITDAVIENAREMKAMANKGTRAQLTHVIRCPNQRFGRIITRTE